MIQLKRMNVVREVASDEEATKLENKGFKRIGGEAEAKSGITEDLAKLGEALYNKLSQEIKAAKGESAPQKESKAGKSAAGEDKGKEADVNGAGTDQPDSGNGKK